jgi:hypothetical protein
VIGESGYRLDSPTVALDGTLSPTRRTIDVPIFIFLKYYMYLRLIFTNMLKSRPNSSGAMYSIPNSMPFDTLSEPPSVNVFENIVAEEDVFQLIGSANGHPTSAKSISAKAHTTQCFGDVSDSTFQQISKDRCANSERDKDIQTHVAKFETHGQGRKLDSILATTAGIVPEENKV